jgi:hypothetical protein
MFPEDHVIYRYKYLPFTEGSLKTITDSTIKYTCPIDFNDPFDCFPYYDTSGLKDLHKTRPDLLAQAARARGFRGAKRITERSKMIAELRNRVEDGEFAKGLLREVGVVSLSKNPRSILMWSHYAEFHRGFVLEFRIPLWGHKEELPLTEQRLMPFPVKYSENRPHVDVALSKDSSFLEDLLLTKSSEWSYEEEERVIDKDRGPGIHPYRRNEILSAVIVGMRMPPDNRARMKSVAHAAAAECENDVLFLIAEPSADRYALAIPGLERENEVQSAS